MNSAQDTPQVSLGGWVAPFGDPGITDRSHLPRAFRSVPRPSSPLSAKASTRCPCFALDHRIAVTGDAAPPPRTGPNPVPGPGEKRGRRPRMKTLLSDQLGASTACPGPVRLGHITTLSAPFNQLRADRPPRCRQIFSERRFRHASGAGFAGAMPTSGPPPFQPRSRYAWRAANRWFADGALSLQSRYTRRPAKLCLPVVEVNGFEPMTSCLQSRRSPS